MITSKQRAAVVEAAERLFATYIEHHENVMHRDMDNVNCDASAERIRERRRELVAALDDLS